MSYSARLGFFATAFLLAPIVMVSSAGQGRAEAIRLGALKIPVADGISARRAGGDPAQVFELCLRGLARTVTRVTARFADRRAALNPYCA
jgi:hypothetical protein